MSTTTATRRPWRRGTRLRTRRTRGAIPAGSIVEVVDVQAHGTGFRYCIVDVKVNRAGHEWIAGRDVERARTPHRRRVSQ